MSDIESESIKNGDDLTNFKNKYNKSFCDILEKFLNLDINEKRKIGPLVNELRHKIDQKYKISISSIISGNKNKAPKIDYTIPVNLNLGNKHPLTNLENRISKIFSNLGFKLVNTQEIEDDWHNFTALNIPLDHPARDMQDTFFINGFNDKLLRTHTTSSQIRILELLKIPTKCVSIGRVYRNETISSRSHCYFNQIDAFYVDKNVNVLDLLHIFRSLFDELFNDKVKLRVRPSYFPFTSPSVEVDIECFLCGIKGCSICKNSGWLEVFGGGVIHKNVLKNCGMDCDKYSGIALGGGIERIALLMHKISDIRFFSANDIRFLKQFKFNSI